MVKLILKHQYYRLSMLITFLLLTAQSLFAAQAHLCLNLFVPALTESSLDLQTTANDLASARAGLSAKSLQSVRKYLDATAKSSQETFRFLKQIREESKLKLYRENPDQIPNVDDLQSAVLNQKAPLFNFLAEKIFPEDFRPNRSEDWIELKKQFLAKFPYNEFIRFQMLTAEAVESQALPYAGLHLFELAQSQLRDIFEDVYQQLSPSAKLGFELALVTRLNRFEKNPLLSKRLFTILTLLNVPSERIQLLLISQWIYFYGDANLLESEAQRDRSTQRQNQVDFKQSLESALYSQLALATKYSDSHNSKLYWLLSTHPEILKFMLNDRVRLLPQAHTFVRQILFDLQNGTLAKKDYGLALTAALYLNNFETDLTLIKASLEILAKARGVYPFIKSDAKKLLRELRAKPLSGN